MLQLASEGECFRYGRTVVEVLAGRLLTTLPDGTQVHAWPQHDQESAARAAALGYGDVVAMTLEHDHVHAWLAEALGLGESPALRDAVTPRTTELGEAEECVVLALQRYLMLLRKRNAA